MTEDAQTQDAQTQGTTVDLRKLVVAADEAMLRGAYASIVNVSVSDHESTLDFVATEPGSLSAGEPRGFLVARVIVANSNLRSVADLLARQADMIEQRAAAQD